MSGPPRPPPRAAPAIAQEWCQKTCILMLVTTVCHNVVTPSKSQGHIMPPIEHFRVLRTLFEGRTHCFVTSAGRGLGPSSEEVHGIAWPALQACLVSTARVSGKPRLCTAAGAQITASRCACPRIRRTSGTSGSSSGMVATCGNRAHVWSPQFSSHLRRLGNKAAVPPHITTRGQPM